MICKRTYALVSAWRRGTRVLLFTGMLLAAFALPDVAAAPEADAGAADAQSRRAANVLAELAEMVRRSGEEQAATAARRESAARRALEDQQQLMRQAIARRDAAQARSDALQARWKENDERYARISEELAQRQGDLGELFGVVRVAAAEAAENLRSSLLSTQYKPKPGEEERSEYLLRLAQTKSLPSFDELQRLWFELLREVAGQGEVVRYQTNVLQAEWGVDAVETSVVRVGPFTTVSGDEYLGYLSNVKSLTKLDGVLPGHFRDVARTLTDAGPDTGYTSAVVDVARGGLLGRYLMRPSWLERVRVGETVGYVIIAVGVIGLLLALFQYHYLLKTRFAVRAQLQNLSQPVANNPLGRLLLTFREIRQQERTEVTALRLHEAVQKEVTTLERFQSFLRLVVAAGPLLGLIGTVTGMIITFHAIVASGGGDPLVMANGIGQAMVATVLGLGIAIPLLFINMGLAAFSRSVTQILDEFSNSLLAEQMKSGKGHDARALLGGGGDPYRPSR